VSENNRILFLYSFQNWDGLPVLVMQPAQVASPEKCRVKNFEKDVEI